MLNTPAELADTKHTMRVVIVGAGPSGLATAVGLANIGMDVVVLEQEASFKPTGSLATLGQEAYDTLLFLGLKDKAAACVQQWHNVLVHDTDYYTSGGSRLFSRKKLASARDGGASLVPYDEIRAMLLEALPEGVVRFNSKVVDVKQSDADVAVALANGKMISGSVVVGADGLHSVVRSVFVRKDSPLTQLGVVFMSGASAAAPPQFCKPDHVMVANGGGCEVQIERRPVLPGSNLGAAGSVVTHVSCIANVAGTKVDTTNPAAAKEWMLNRLSAGGWNPRIVEAVRGIDTNTITAAECVDRGPLHARSPRWPLGRITLLGDAAHPPHAATTVGVHLGLLDAASLTRNLSSLESETNLLVALKKYESYVFESSAPVITSRRSGLYQRVATGRELFRSRLGDLWSYRIKGPVAFLAVGSIAVAGAWYYYGAPPALVSNKQ